MTYNYTISNSIPGTERRAQQVSAVTQKKERLEARIPSNMKKLIQKAADLEGRTLTDFIISSSVNAARTVIREQTTLELTARDQTLFAEALLNPPEPQKSLRVAAAKYRLRTDNE
jgi:uncharacterized protein (DUF1778 family)